MSGNLSTEKLFVTFPKSDLQIKFNGVSAGTVDDIYMPNPVTIDIKQDFNKHPTSGYSGYLPTGGAPINGTHHVFRHYAATNDTAITPTFKLDTKYVVANASSSIVEWEFHVKNQRTSGDNLTINTPVVKVGDDENWFNDKVVALTD